MPASADARNTVGVMFANIRSRKYQGKELQTRYVDLKEELDDCYWGYAQGANFVDGWKQGASRPFGNIPEFDVQPTPEETDDLYRRLQQIMAAGWEFILWQESQKYFPANPFDLPVVELARQTLLGFRNDVPTEYAQIEAWFRQIGLTFDIDVTVQ